MAIVMINTDRREPFHIKRGDRIAQLVILRVEEVCLIKVESLDDTSRGDGGFGSTGTGHSSVT